jgi:hypothetical protein
LIGVGAVGGILAKELGSAGLQVVAMLAKDLFQPKLRQRVSILAPRRRA